MKTGKTILISYAVAAVGCIVLAGWLFDINLLRSVAPGLPEMVINTALGFLLCGVSLWFACQEDVRGKRVAQIFALIVAAIGVLTAGEYLSGVDFGIDRLLMPDGDVSAITASLPGRMSPHTAFNFVLAGCALLVSDASVRGRIRPAELLAVMCGMVSLLALVGYVYSVAFLYRISAQTGMALHTAATFLLLSIGILTLHSDKGLMRVVTNDDLSGTIARRLLAASIAIPLLLGWLTMMGQRAQIFDAAMSSSLLVVGNIIVLSALVWTSARTLDRVDTRRRIAEAARGKLLHRDVGAQEDERRRIARELHDQMGQHLAALSLQLELHRATLDNHTIDNPHQPTMTDDGMTDDGMVHQETHLAQVMELAARLSSEAHALAWELRPPELDHLGLQAALARYVEQWSQRANVKMDFVCTGFAGQRLPAQVEVALYRIAQEALTNVLKHARAVSVSLVLELEQAEVVMLVEDDGCGFDVEASGDASHAEHGLGLLGMRERAELIGGKLNIESAPDAGTTLVVRLPLITKENLGANEHE